MAKLVTVIVLATLLAAGLLGLRQQRLSLMHDMAVTHHQINGTRQSLWDWQFQIYRQIQPKRLQEAIVRAGLELEPVTPIPAKPAKLTKAAAGNNRTLRD